MGSVVGLEINESVNDQQTRVVVLFQFHYRPLLLRSCDNLVCEVWLMVGAVLSVQRGLADPSGSVLGAWPGGLICMWYVNRAGWLCVQAATC